MLRKIIFPCLVVIASGLVFGCSQNQDNKVALVDGKVISIESVDSVIQDKLYDRLFDIYYNRSITLDYLISDELIKKEAVNRHMSVDSLLRLEVYKPITP